MDVVLEMLNSEAIDMLESADLFWIEGSSCSVSGSMQEIVHPRSQPLNVRSAEDRTTARFQDPENLGEVILMVLDMFGDLDGNGAVDALIGKWDRFVEIAAVIGHIFHLEIELRKIAGGQILAAVLPHLGTEKPRSCSDIQDAGALVRGEQG